MALGPLHGSQAIQATYEYTFPGGLAATLNLTIWYDTSVYSSNWSWFLPPGFSPVSARDSLGPLQYSATQDGEDVLVTLTTHYPPATGVRSFQIVATANMKTLGSGLLLAQLSAVPALNSGSTAYLIIDAPLGGVLLDTHGSEWSRFANESTKTIDRSFVVMASSAMSTYAVRSFGPYAILRPTDAEWSNTTRDREVTVLEDTVQLLPEITNLTGRPLSNDSFLVVYGPDSLFTWEAGYQTGGLIALHASALENPAPDWRVEEDRTLIHETMHAILGLTLQGNGDLLPSWFNEGSARYTEWLVDDAHPTLAAGCNETVCWDSRSRPFFYTVQGVYAGNESYSLDWTPGSSASEADRSLGYDYSSYVIGAFIQQHGVASYRSVYQTLNATILPTDDQTNASAAVWTAFQRVGVTSQFALVHPYSDVYNASVTQFHADIRPLLREPIAADSGGSGGPLPYLGTGSGASIPGLSGGETAIAALVVALLVGWGLGSLLRRRR
ncbi:MAG: hypothetical protein ACYDDF_00525 [Thermoplasmatota archaeon]